MKWRNKAIYAAFVILFIGYLLSINHIITASYPSAKLTKETVVELQNKIVRCNIEQYEISENMLECVSFSGWGFVETEHDNSNKEIGLVLIGEENYLFSGMPTTRSDVYSYYYSDCNIKGERHGFDFYFSTIGIPYGIYQVGLSVFENAIDYGIARSNLVLIKDSKGIYIEEFTSAESDISNYSFSEESSLMNIERAFIRENDALEISGWGYVPNFNSTQQTVFIQLGFADGTVKTFNSIPKLREDVARVFNDDKYKMSGFYALIPREEIINGSLTARILIENDGILYAGAEKVLTTEENGVLYLGGLALPTDQDAQPNTGSNSVATEESGVSITKTISAPLIVLMQFCYDLLDNFVLAIFFFTLLTKIILLPVTLWVHRSGIRMVEMMPEINRLKIKHFGDKETIADETQALYKQKNYHPLASSLPMIIQVVLLMGVIEAVKALLGSSDNVLNLIPAESGGMTMLMPLATGLAALALALAQNKISPLQREQARAEQIMTGAISVGISLFLGAFVSLGTGVYWIASNLISIFQQLFLNWLIKPEKYVDYQALEESRKELKSMSSLDNKISKEDKKREKADYKRFFSVANKHLVFYSEKSGFYKFFQNTIEYLLAYSNVIIHYVTNDPKDQIFELAKQQPRIRPYYIGPKKIITLFMKMDADIVVTTTPDLETYFLKRSYIRKDIEYIYMFHGMTSTNMVVRKGAYDHYDTILCVGQHQIDELRECEEMYHLPAKNLVPCGYGMYDNLLKAYEAMPKKKHEKLQVMVAPSWQEGNIIESCIDTVLDELMNRDCRVILRPHPEFIKRFPGKMEILVRKCAKYNSDQLEVQTDFSSNESIYASDVMITDWSGIAYEFAFTTKHPVLFVDTPIKVLNEDYVKYKNQPTDITFRNQVGKSVELDRIGEFSTVFDDIVANRDSYEKEIDQLARTYVFHIGESGKISARYLLDKLLSLKGKKISNE